MSPKKDESVFVILFRDKEVLLIERTDLCLYALPGGAVEENETPEDAAVREVFEETGVKIAIKRKLTTYLPQGLFTKKTYYYEGAYLEGSPSPSNESNRSIFVPLDCLPKKMPSFFHSLIEDALSIEPLPLFKPFPKISILKTLFNHPVYSLLFLFSRVKKLFKKEDPKDQSKKSK